MGHPLRQELDGWSASMHASGDVATGDVQQALGFVNTSFSSQSVLQNPGVAELRAQ